MLNYNYETGIPGISQYSRVQTYNRLNTPNLEPFNYPMPEYLFSLSLPEVYETKIKKSEDIVGEIFGDKIKAQRATIDGLLAQIGERKKLRESNLLAILRGECTWGSELLQLEDKLKYSYAAGPGADKTRAAIEKELLNMARERRFEDVGCWRDLVFLRKELINALEEYRTALRKRDMLSGR